MIDAPEYIVFDLRISGDGSMVFCLDAKCIQAWSIWVGESMGKKYHNLVLMHDPFLLVDGLKVWIPFYGGQPKAQGWDFGASDLPTFELLNAPSNWPCLNFIGLVREHRLTLPGIEDTVTRKMVFQLPVRLTRPSDVQWDGQYLVVGYHSGEVLIVECTYEFH